MNSLVSPTKVITNESIPNPIPPLVSSNISLPSEIPVSTISVPIMDLKSYGDDILPHNQGITNESSVQTKDESDTLMADINAKSDDSAVRQPESLNNSIYSQTPLSEMNMNANNELTLLNNNQHSIETDKNSSVNIDEDSSNDVIVDDCDERDDNKDVVNGAMSIEGKK